MLTVIYAEFTNTKLAIDTTYSLSTKSLSKMSSILLDSSLSSRIVVWDPLHWSDNTRGLPSKAFTNEQRKLWFVAQRNSQPADKTEYNTVKLSHSGKGSCLWFTSPCTWKFVRHNRTCTKVGSTTAIEACQDVIEALYELRSEYIKFPTTVAETMRCIETFTDKSRLPNIVEAIDETHIKIISPRDSAVDYFSRNQQHDSSCCWR